MIDKNNPLPKHTKMDYYECYAKVVLEDLYPEEFMNIELNDKPDLQSIDGIHGIEVTNARDKDQINAESIYTDISHNRISNITAAKEKINKLNCKLEDGILIGKPGTDSFDLIIKAFEGKLNKLNRKGYKIFKYNSIFIFSDIHTDDKMIIDAISKMQELQKDVDLKFNRVFILLPHDLYNFNLSEGNFIRSKIKPDIQMMHSIKAREIVEISEEL